MSWQATAWALKQRTGQSGAKLTLLALASHANKAGIAWPSQWTLAEETEQSLDSIQRHTELLVERGLISTKRLPGQHGHWPSLEYRLHITGPHGAAWTEPHGAGRRRAENTVVTGPQIPPSPGRTVRHKPSSKESEESGEPRGSKAAAGGSGGSLACAPDGALRSPPTSEVEPSVGAVPDHARSRQEEEPPLAAKRKDKPTMEELRERYPDLLGKIRLKTI